MCDPQEAPLVKPLLANGLGATGLVKNNLKQHLQAIKGSPAIKEVKLCAIKEHITIKEP